jgi:hypothetical protein
LDLRLVESVRELNIEALAVLGVNTESDGLDYSQLCAKEIALGIRRNAVVVGGVGESKRKHTLLLQVGFVLE